MKKIMLFIITTILLIGCSKEVQINSKLEGSWDVDLRTTYWGNNGSPGVEEEKNYAIAEFNKDGKGTLTIPDGQAVLVYDTTSGSNGHWTSSHYEYIDLVYEMSYVDDGSEKIKLEKDGDITYLDLSWNWDKKNFVAVFRENTQYFYEEMYTFRKQN